MTIARPWWCTPLVQPLRPVAERVDGEHRGQQDLGGAAADEQPAAVDVVGQGAAPESEHDERHQLGDPDRTDREVGAGQPVDLEGDRDVGDHPAEVEDGAGDEEQPEVTRLAQG